MPPEGLAFAASTTRTVAGPDYTFPATWYHFVPTLQLYTNLGHRQFLVHRFCKFFAYYTLLLSGFFHSGLTLSCALLPHNFDALRMG